MVSHLHATIVKEDSVSRQLSMHKSIQIWLDLHSAIVKEGSVSRQSSIHLFRYSWIHLLAVIVKEDSVSHQFSIHLLRYSWIHSHSAIVTWEQCQPSTEDGSIQIWLDSLTRYNGKGRQYQPYIYSDMAGFTYFLQSKGEHSQSSIEDRSIQIWLDSLTRYNGKTVSAVNIHLLRYG